MSILTEELEDLINNLEDAKTTVGNQQGPLVDPELATTRIKLTNAQSHISNIISLIFGVGAPDQNNLPGDLPSIADECVTLADDALTEARRPAPNNTVIGNKVKTIDRIIDVNNGYKDRAGI
jgi:hypothetical protein